MFVLCCLSEDRPHSEERRHMDPWEWLVADNSLFHLCPAAPKYHTDRNKPQLDMGNQIVGVQLVLVVAPHPDRCWYYVLCNFITLTIWLKITFIIMYIHFNVITEYILIWVLKLIYRVYHYKVFLRTPLSLVKTLIVNCEFPSNTH